MSNDCFVWKKAVLAKDTHSGKGVALIFSIIKIYTTFVNPCNDFYQKAIIDWWVVVAAAKLFPCHWNVARVVYRYGAYLETKRKEVEVCVRRCLFVFEKVDWHLWRSQLVIFSLRIWCASMILLVVSVVLALTSVSLKHSYVCLFVGEGGWEEEEVCQTGRARRNSLRFQSLQSHREWERERDFVCSIILMVPSRMCYVIGHYYSDQNQSLQKWRLAFLTMARKKSIAPRKNFVETAPPTPEKNHISKVHFRR